jgi:hypothetical protein
MWHTAFSNASTGCGAGAEVARRRLVGRFGRWATLLRRPGSAATWVLVMGLIGQLALSLYWSRDGWLGVDGLYYISSRGGLEGDHTSIFAPYAGHWQPVLISLYLVLWWVFGLHSYLPYALPAILTHLVICALLYGLLRRVGLGPWVSLVPAWVVLWYGTGGETWLADAPFALTCPLALGLVALHVIVRRPDSARAPWVACALLTLGLGVSATGVVAALLVGLFVLGARGVGTALRVALVPAVVFAVWFLVSGRTGGRVRVSAEDLLGVPRDALSVLVLPLGDVAGLASLGPLLTLGIVLVAVLARVDSAPLRALALAGIGAAVAQTCLSVVANADLGLESWGVGRYRYLVLVMLVPALAVTLDVAVRLARVAVGSNQVLVIGLSMFGLLALTVNGIDAERSQAAFTRAVAAHYLTYMRGTLVATDLGERMLTPDVPRLLVMGEDLVRLARPEHRDEFSIGTPDDEDRLRTENFMYVGVGPQTFTLPAPAGLGSGDFDRPLSEEFGCETYRATKPPILSLTSLDGGQIAVTSDSRAVTTRLVRDGLEGEPRTWGVTPGETVYIATSAELAQLWVSFDAAGEFKICRA